MLVLRHGGVDMTRTFKANQLKSHIKLVVWLFLIITFVLVISSSLIYTAHADTTNTFSGILTDQNGNAISGVSVQLRDAQNNRSTSMTNSTGNFSIEVSPGTYSLKIQSSSWLTNPARLVNFTLAQPISNPTIDLTSNDISQDLTLPLGKVSYTERNAQGYGSGYRKIIAKAPAASTPPVSFYPGAPDAISEQPTSTRDMMPNGDGTGDFTSILGTTYAGTLQENGNLQNGICTIVVTHPSQAECNETPFTVTDATNNVDIPKPPLPRNTFTGTFRDSTGASVPGIKITLRDSYGNKVSDISNDFSIAVEPGMYSLIIEGLYNHSPFGVFKFAQPSSSPTIDLTSGDASQDLTLPVGIVNFTATYQNGDPIMYGNFVAKGTITDPISLYPDGPMFNPISTNLHSPKIFSNYQGIGTFKAIVGSTYSGTSTADGVCTIDFSILCNSTPLVVGTNNISISSPR